jgi:DNA invertase Pin-like site-specific DNA recombinase
MKNIGYLRVSTDKQAVAYQRHIILEYANDHNFNIHKFYEYQVSSKKSTADRGVDSLIEELQQGDLLIVSELSRIGRSLGQIIRIIDDLMNKGVTFVSVKENLSLAGAHDRHNKVMIAMFGLLAELERDLISERTTEGIKSAQNSGVKFGRPKGKLGKSKLDGKEAEIKILLEKKIPKSSIAKIMDVSVTTVRNFIKSRRIK